MVFGATGGVGQHVVRRAAEAGHQVTAFARTPEKLEARDGVEVVRGDAFDAAAVAASITGQEAVISCLSSSAPMKRSDEVTRMVINIVQGMRTAGVDRITYCASAGVEGELLGPIGRGVMWLLRHALADHRGALASIANSGLTATVARPTSLSNASFDPNYLEAFEGMPNSSRPIPRSSVADFLVKALEQSDIYRNTSVGLALPKRDQSSA